MSIVGGDESSMRILVIEDDEKMRPYMKGPQQTGMEVDHA